MHQPLYRRHYKSTKLSIFEKIFSVKNSPNKQQKIITVFGFKIKFGKRVNVSVIMPVYNTKGEYLTRMDSDDISLPQRLSKQVKYLNQHQDISIFSSSFKTFPQGKEFLRTKPISFLDILKSARLPI